MEFILCKCCKHFPVLEKLNPALFNLQKELFKSFLGKTAFVLIMIVLIFESINVLYRITFVTILSKLFKKSRNS